MKLETFFEKFDQFADAPDAVAKMRELVLELAVQGKLVRARRRRRACVRAVEASRKPNASVKSHRLEKQTSCLSRRGSHLRRFQRTGRGLSSAILCASSTGRAFSRSDESSSRIETTFRASESTIGRLRFDCDSETDRSRRDTCDHSGRRSHRRARPAVRSDDSSGDREVHLHSAIKLACNRSRCSQGSRIDYVLTASLRRS